MLKIENLSKTFKEFKINNVSLDINSGDYFIILGKSGAGKSLLLEMVAGVMNPDSGKIFLDNEDITQKKIQNRKVGLVFQDFALFPHLMVKDNIAYPLKKKIKSKTELYQKVEEFAKETGVSHLLERYPEKLSGGEKQRVALARTLANNPTCLLLDEPLASLDVQLKEDLRELLRKINSKGITIVHVTHDYEEAIALANKVAVMNDGEIIQKGNIHDVFQNPDSEFVARFTGVKNFFSAELESANSAKINNDISFRVNAKKEAGNVQLLIESKHIIVSNNVIESSAVNNFKGVIARVVSTPFGFELQVNIGIILSVQITLESKLKYEFIVGKEVWLSFKASEVKVIY